MEGGASEGRLYVTHEHDEEDGVIWQFHCGNGGYDPAILQMVRLDEIIEIDPAIYAIAGLPLGYCARRSHGSSEWTTEKDGS